MHVQCKQKVISNANHRQKSVFNYFVAWNYKVTQIVIFIDSKLKVNQNIWFVCSRWVVLRQLNKL